MDSYHLAIQYHAPLFQREIPFSIPDNIQGIQEYNAFERIGRYVLGMLLSCISCFHSSDTRRLEIFSLFHDHAYIPQTDQTNLIETKIFIDKHLLQCAERSVIGIPKASTKDGQLAIIAAAYTGSDDWISATRVASLITNDHLRKANMPSTRAVIIQQTEEHLSAAIGHAANRATTLLRSYVSDVTAFLRE